MTEPRSSRLVLAILGMHRAGTSLLSNILGMCGLEHASDLMPANEFNSGGYWESRPVVRLNDRILKRHDRYWSDPKPMEDSSLEGGQVDALSLAASELLEQEFSLERDLVLKDPRLSRTFPVWRQAFEELSLSPACIIVSRHPADVVASLKRRDNFSAEHSAALWLISMLEAEENSRDIPRALIHYEDLVERQSAALEGPLAETWPAGLEKLQAPSDEIAAAVRGRPAASSYDQVSGETELGSRLTSLAIDLHSLLCTEGLGNPVGIEAIRSETLAVWHELSADRGPSVYLPQTHGWHFERSHLLEGSGRFKEALDAARTASELQPNWAKNREQYSRLLLKLGRIDEARDECRQMIEIDPDDAAAQDLLSTIEEKAENPTESVSAAKRAIALGSENPYTFFRLGRLLQRDGPSLDAMRYLEGAILLDSENKTFREEHDTLAAAVSDDLPA